MYKRQGLTGLEVYYKNLELEQVEQFAMLAKKSSLIASGGSDYHGIHDDEREPGDISFEKTKVEQFVDDLEKTWKALGVKK